MSRWNLAWLVGLAAIGLVGLSMFMTLPTRASTLQKKHENYKLLVDVLEEVQKKYAKELTPDEIRKLIEDMINGGLHGFDQHSYFYNKEDHKEFKRHSDGRFFGIGVQIGVNKLGQLYVISPMFGTPAFEAGLLAGDRILKIDDEPTDKMDIEDAKKHIIGEKDTKVKLTVLHVGAKTPVDLEIRRAEIHIESVMGDRRNPVNLKEWDFWVDRKEMIAYVRLTSFSKDTKDEMLKVIETLRGLGMRGLVLDLRGNPGGLLTSAVEVSSMFLPEGKNVVTTRGRAKAEEHVYNSAPPVPGFKPHVASDYPIAILLNRGSASAAEILAAALQDHNRAIVVGERSYGKGSVQNMIPMEGGASALKLTTAFYWRPSGRNINRKTPTWSEDDKEEWGVKPDAGYEVKLTDEELRDYFLWRRERDIIRGEDPKKDDKESKVKKDFADKVLVKAMDYIRAELAKGAKADVAVPATTALAPATLLPTLPEFTTGARADLARRPREVAPSNRGPIIR